MRNVTTFICLTLVVLLVSGCQSMTYQRGLDAYIRGDYATVLREWKPLAKHGNSGAQYYLGQMYSNGQGVIRNDKTAMKWYTLAAKQGHAKSQYNLGFMYDKGQGVPQDYKTSVKWYRLAAEQGYASAQYNLGGMYANGLGTHQDLIRAFMWFSFSASFGQKEGIEGRAIIERKMTPSQIETAQKLASECIKKKYKQC